MAHTIQKTASVLVMIALAACGGGGGSTADTPSTQPVPTQPTTVQDTGDASPLTPSDPIIAPVPAVEDTPPTQTPEDVPTADPVVSLPPAPEPVAPPPAEPTIALPVAIDPNDPLLLATLAQIEANETAISAAVLVTDPDTGVRSLLTREGLYARIDGSLTLQSLTGTVNADVTGDFDNAASFSQSDAVGIVGLATPLAQMRTTGDAQFVGGAAGFVIDGASGVDLINGTSTIDVAFGVGRVNITLDGFEAISQITGDTVTSPVSEMSILNATIADGGFSGGTFTTFDADGTVDLTGDNTLTLAQGQFFGLDADGETPDEVGGVVLSQGDSGIVFGTFIAD